MAQARPGAGSRDWYARPHASATQCGVATRRVSARRRRPGWSPCSGGDSLHRPRPEARGRSRTGASSDSQSAARRARRFWPMRADAWQDKSDDLRAKPGQALADPRLQTQHWVQMAYGHDALYVMASLQGTVMRTSDEGKTWQELPLHLTTRMLVGCVQGDRPQPRPNAPDRIYASEAHRLLRLDLNIVVGRPPTARRGGVEFPLELVRSEDGGKTWLDIPPGGHGYYGCPAEDGQVRWPARPRPDRSSMPPLCAATPSSRPPVVRSLDGGKTWEAFGDQAGPGLRHVPRQPTHRTRTRRVRRHLATRGRDLGTAS